jgi:hypothetical protein
MEAASGRSMATVIERSLILLYHVLIGDGEGTPPGSPGKTFLDHAVARRS